MLNLLRFLKQSWAAVLVILILLVGQAFCDLTLPSYTSNIVNVGIQQGGVEHATPEALRVDTLNKLLLLMDADQAAQVQSSYTLADPAQETDIQKYKEQYPLVAEQPLYILKEDVQPAALDDTMGTAILLLSTMEGDSETSQAIKEQFAAGLSAEQLAAMGGEVQPLQVLALMPEAARQQLVGQMQEKMTDMPDSLVDQAAVSYVRAEYEALQMDVNGRQSAYIWNAGLMMLLLALGSMAATVLAALIASRVAAGVSQNLRSGLFRKVISFSSKEVEAYSTSSLITRSTNDIQQIQLLIVLLLRIVLYAPILAVGGIIKVLQTNASMAWIIAVAVGVMLVSILVLFLVTMPRFKKMQSLIDKVNLVTREILTGLPVIRAFSRQRFEENRFDGANKDLTRVMLFITRTMALMMPMMMLLMNGISALIIWVGAGSIDAGAMQVGDMMVFIQYAMQIIISFLMLSMMSIMLPRALVAANRVAEVLDTESSIHDPEQPADLSEDKTGEVQFDDVCFRYPDAEKDVLSHVSFTAKPGEVTAFIGSTGCGKSTLINLIPRFFDVTSGKVLVNGRDVREIKQEDLRVRLGYVPQKGVLFSGTIDSNIRYGAPQASQEQVCRAAKIAQAMDFIEEKPEGFETEIAQGGSNVSGGQKQRLAIARAVAPNPDIYIFDDSFSALDYRTDVALRAALSQQLQGATVLIVAQRISTILHAQQIVVLDEGKVVGIGTHEQLLKECGVYQQIASSQLSMEELADV